MNLLFLTFRIHVIVTLLHLPLHSTSFTWLQLDPPNVYVDIHDSPPNFFVDIHDFPAITTFTLWFNFHFTGGKHPGRHGITPHGQPGLGCCRELQ